MEAQPESPGSQPFQDKKEKNVERAIQKAERIKQLIKTRQEEAQNRLKEVNEQYKSTKSELERQRERNGRLISELDKLYRTKRSRLARLRNALGSKHSRVSKLQKDFLQVCSQRPQKQNEKDEKGETENSGSSIKKQTAWDMCKKFRDDCAEVEIGVEDITGEIVDKLRSFKRDCRGLVKKSDRMKDQLPLSMPKTSAEVSEHGKEPGKGVPKEKQQPSLPASCTESDTKREPKSDKSFQKPQTSVEPSVTTAPETSVMTAPESSVTTAPEPPVKTAPESSVTTALETSVKTALEISVKTAPESSVKSSVPSDSMPSNTDLLSPMPPSTQLSGGRDVAESVKQPTSHSKKTSDDVASGSSETVTVVKTTLQEDSAVVEAWRNATAVPLPHNTREQSLPSGGETAVKETLSKQPATVRFQTDIVVPDSNENASNQPVQNPQDINATPETDSPAARPDTDRGASASKAEEVNHNGARPKTYSGAVLTPQPPAGGADNHGRQHCTGGSSQNGGGGQRNSSSTSFRSSGQSGRERGRDWRNRNGGQQRDTQGERMDTITAAGPGGWGRPEEHSGRDVTIKLLTSKRLEQTGYTGFGIYDPNTQLDGFKMSADASVGDLIQRVAVHLAYLQRGRFRLWIMEPVHFCKGHLYPRRLAQGCVVNHQPPPPPRHHRRWPRHGRGRSGPPRAFNGAAPRPRYNQRQRSQSQQGANFSGNNSSNNGLQQARNPQPASQSSLQSSRGQAQNPAPQQNAPPPSSQGPQPQQNGANAGSRAVAENDCELCDIGEMFGNYVHKDLRLRVFGRNELVFYVQERQTENERLFAFDHRNLRIVFLKKSMPGSNDHQLIRHFIININETAQVAKNEMLSAVLKNRLSFLRHMDFRLYLEHSRHIPIESAGDANFKEVVESLSQERFGNGLVFVLCHKNVAHNCSLGGNLVGSTVDNGQQAAKNGQMVPMGPAIHGPVNMNGLHVYPLNYPVNNMPHGAVPRPPAPWMDTAVVFAQPAVSQPHVPPVAPLFGPMTQYQTQMPHYSVPPYVPQSQPQGNNACFNPPVYPYQHPHTTYPMGGEGPSQPPPMQLPGPMQQQPPPQRQRMPLPILDPETRQPQEIHQPVSAANTQQSQAVYQPTVTATNLPQSQEQYQFIVHQSAANANQPQVNQPGMSATNAWQPQAFHQATVETASIGQPQEVHQSVSVAATHQPQQLYQPTVSSAQTTMPQGAHHPTASVTQNMVQPSDPEKTLTWEQQMHAACDGGNAVQKQRKDEQNTSSGATSQKLATGEAVAQNPVPAADNAVSSLPQSSAVGTLSLPGNTSSNAVQNLQNPSVTLQDQDPAKGAPEKAVSDPGAEAAGDISAAGNSKRSAECKLKEDDCKSVSTTQDTGSNIMVQKETDSSSQTERSVTNCRYLTEEGNSGNAERAPGSCSSEPVSYMEDIYRNSRSTTISLGDDDDVFSLNDHSHVEQQPNQNGMHSTPRNSSGQASDFVVPSRDMNRTVTLPKFTSQIVGDSKGTSQIMSSDQGHSAVQNIIVQSIGASQVTAQNIASRDVTTHQNRASHSIATSRNNTTLPNRGATQNGTVPHKTGVSHVTRRNGDSQNSGTSQKPSAPQNSSSAQSGSSESCRNGRKSSSTNRNGKMPGSEEAITDRTAVPMKSASNKHLLFGVYVENKQNYLYFRIDESGPHFCQQDDENTWSECFRKTSFEDFANRIEIKKISGDRPQTGSVPKRTRGDDYRHGEFPHPDSRQPVPPSDSSGDSHTLSSSDTALGTSCTQSDTTTSRENTPSASTNPSPAQDNRSAPSGASRTSLERNTSSEDGAGSTYSVLTSEDDSRMPFSSGTTNAPPSPSQYSERSLEASGGFSASSSVTFIERCLSNEGVATDTETNPANEENDPSLLSPPRSVCTTESAESEPKPDDHKSQGSSADTLESKPYDQNQDDASADKTEPKASAESSKLEAKSSSNENEANTSSGPTSKSSTRGERTLDARAKEFVPRYSSSSATSPSVSPTKRASANTPEEIRELTTETSSSCAPAQTGEETSQTISPRKLK